MIVIVPARGGSKRIPRKNLQVVGGKTLVRRALETACGAGLWGLRVVLTSDDPEILSQSEGLNLTLRLRPSWAAEDKATTGDAVSDAADGLSLGLSPSDRVCVLEPTNPFLTVPDLEMCVRLVADCGRRLASYNDRGRNGIFIQSLVQWRNKDIEKKWGEKSIRWATIHPGVDINTPEDLEEARRLWKELHGE